MKVKRYTTIFPQAENIHLIKDIGMISFLMHIQYGLIGEVVTYKNDSYAYADGPLKGLKLTFLKRIFHVATLDVCFFLFFNARKIDYLQLFHVRVPTLIWIMLYKLLNPGGKIFLKSDANLDTLKLLVSKFNRCIYLPILRFCSLIAAETRIIQTALKAQCGLSTTYLPNGVYNFHPAELLDFSHRENSICTIGRIGFPDKGHDILLEAFKLFHPKFPQYTLKLIGPIDAKFQAWINLFLQANNNLRDSIIFLDPIYDRAILRSETQKSKIFCSSSLSESFGMATIEAMEAGCCLVSTLVLATNDITNDGKLAFLCPPGDIRALANCLSEAAENDNKMRKLSSEGEKFVLENFYWPVIVKKIAGELQIR